MMAAKRRSFVWALSSSLRCVQRLAQFIATDLGTQELPNHLVEHVEHVDDLLRQLPVEAVSISTTKGTIDKKKTAELQQRIQEEEYQLELYSSTRTSSSRPQRKSRRVQYYDSSTALIDAAEARTGPRLTLRVRVLQDLTFQVDKLSNENDAPVDSDAEEPASAPAQLPSASTEPATVYYMPPASLRKKLPSVEEPLPALSRRRTALPRRFADSGACTDACTALDATTPGEVMDIIENLAAGNIVKSSQKKRPRMLVRQPTAQDAMDYVERMRNVYKIDQQTIATFVGLLKVGLLLTVEAQAYADDISRRRTRRKQSRAKTLRCKLRIFSRFAAPFEATSEGRASQDYPDLIEDFDKFLPLGKGSKSLRLDMLPATVRL